MSYKDLIDLVFTNLKLRKNRTILTILGVVIGSTCIFTLMSLGLGLKKSSSESFESLGDARTISVYPSPKGYFNEDSNSSKIKIKDSLDDKSIKEIKNIDGVDDLIVRLLIPVHKVFFKEKPIQCSIIGLNINSSLTNKKLLYGKYPNSNEKKGVIGFNLACILLNISPQDLKVQTKVKKLLNKSIEIEYFSEEDNSFSNDNNIEDIENIEDKKKNKLIIEICGISAMNSEFSSEIYLPLNIGKKIYKSVHSNENKVQYSSMSVICEDLKSVSSVEKNILKLGYTAFSLNSVKESINKIMTLITMFLGFLGSISLLISSFGILNTMNMSILERRKEIGIIKVLGANISDVKKIFVCEALVIGFIGGIIGIFTGLIINSLGNYIMRIYETSNNESTYTNMFIVTPFLVIFILVFSSLMGLLSGLYPATKASKLDVISTLKDE